MVFEHKNKAERTGALFKKALEDKFSKDPVTVTLPSNKYHNQKVHTGSITFDSKLEERRYYQLRNDPNVIDIEVHPVFEVFPGFKKNGKTYRAITYIADFKVKYKDGSVRIEDVKGHMTDVFMMKWKLFEKAYPDLTLTIVTSKDMKEQKQSGRLNKGQFVGNYTVKRKVGK